MTFTIAYCDVEKRWAGKYCTKFLVVYVLNYKGVAAVQTAHGRKFSPHIFGACLFGVDILDCITKGGGNGIILFLHLRKGE